jgi:transcriptional antiterminator
MNLSNKQKIERIDQLIRMETTGNPKELAVKLSISERTVYNLINKMISDFEAPIEFDIGKRSYIYKEKGKIVMKFIRNRNNVTEMTYENL